MSRLLFGLFAAALVGAVSLSSAAQDKKDQPKKVERIALADPKDVAKDPDFTIQGEYIGVVPTAAVNKKFGAQVVAKGGGEFYVRVLTGGLPGDGWDGNTQEKGTGKRGEDGTTSVTGPKLSGVISVGMKVGTMQFVAKLGTVEITFAKVDRKSKTIGEKPPAGATVLFGGVGDEKNWDGGKLTELSDGKFLNVGIKSKQKFGAFKAHVEFRLPWMPNSGGQGRGNSGVYLQDRYELQVLDSFGLSGENNECGGFYQAHKPLVNMCFPPLSWQTYDIEFTPAAVGADGKKTANAKATVFHNGVKIHDGVEFKAQSGGGQPETAMPGPFQFQNHGDPVVYNNVWVVEVK